MPRKIIVAATAAILVVGTAAAVAKNPIHDHSGPEYDYSFVPYHGYGRGYGYDVPADRHDPTDTNGF